MQTIAKILMHPTIYVENTTVATNYNHKRQELDLNTEKTVWLIFKPRDKLMRTFLVLNFAVIIYNLFIDFIRLNIWDTLNDQICDNDYINSLVPSVPCWDGWKVSIFGNSRDASAFFFFSLMSIEKWILSNFRWLMLPPSE